jgi:hypothetical protein
MYSRLAAKKMVYAGARRRMAWELSRVSAWIFKESSDSSWV